MIPKTPQVPETPTLDKGITIEQWRILRQKGRTNLIYLAKYILGYEDVSREVHGAFIDCLQKFPGGRDWTNTKWVGGRQSPGSLDELTKNYEPATANLWDLENPAGKRKWLILMPRGHLKSTIMMSHMIQWILNYPNVRICLSSGTGGQVSGFLKEIKQHFQFNETFRWLYPEFCPSAKNVKEFGNQEQFTVPNCRRANAKEPTVGTLSVGATVASTHYDVISNDDVVDKENVRTPEQILTVKSHLGMLWPLLETAPNAQNRPVGYQRGWWYVTGTTYDYSDSYGQILEDDLSRREKGEQPTYIINKQSAVLEGELSRDDCRAECDLPKPHPIYKHCRTLWPQRLPPEGLLEIAEDPLQGWGVLSCTPSESPILMADWTEKPISQIKAGDEVVGFKAGGPLNRMKLCKTKVKAIHQTSGVVIKLVMSTGREVRCTIDHKWWTMRTPSPKDTHKAYMPARVGCELFSVVSPLPELTPDQQRWMDWLGGILDGEGSCHGRNSIFISQSETVNPEVCEGIKKCLNILGFEWTQFNRPAGSYGGRNHQKATQWMLKGGRKVMRQIMLQARMLKWERISNSMFIRGAVREIKGATHKVVAMWPQGHKQVYALETETGNYVVWGFASSNSQYLMNPVPDSSGLVNSADEIVWVPQKNIRELYAYLSLHVTVDLAGMEPSTNKLADNDFTVINLHGFGHDGTLYILSVLRGRYTPFEVINLLFNLVALHPRIFDIKVEKEAHARVLLPFLKRDMEKRQRWLPIVEIRRDNRASKQQRIKGLQPWFQNGSIKFAEGQASKLGIINEIMRFPKYAHDDILDTIADAMQNRDGGVTSEVMPQSKQYATNDPNRPIAPDLKYLLDRIWGQIPEEEQTSNVDLVTGW